MSSGASGSDEKISATKIDPLASETKANVPHDQSSRGAVESDRNVDRARIAPLGGAGTSFSGSILFSPSRGMGMIEDLTASRCHQIDTNTPSLMHRLASLDQIRVLRKQKSSRLKVVTWRKVGRCLQV